MRDYTEGNDCGELSAYSLVQCQDGTDFAALRLVLNFSVDYIIISCKITILLEANEEYIYL